MSHVVHLRSMLACAAFAMFVLPGRASAQEAVIIPSASPVEFAIAEQPLSPPTPLTASLAQAASAQPVQLPAPSAESRSRGLLMPLYVSFAALQMLDAHSTIRGLDAGAHEQNPLMRGIVERPAALVALKSGVAVSTIMLTDRVARHNRTAAVIMMVALNSLYATVVAHNYSVVR